MEISLPEDALVVLVGAAGCGKSTFAARHFLPTQTVASDTCRALVADDEADPNASADAFTLMHLIIEFRLKRGRLTVADATNVHADKRAALLALAGRWRRPAVAIVFDVPESVCQGQNRLRAHRVLPPQAIRGQLKALREALPGLAGEGFDAVHVLHEEAVDAVRVGVGPAVRRTRLGRNG